MSEIVLRKAHAAKTGRALDSRHDQAARTVETAQVLGWVCAAQQSHLYDLDPASLLCHVEARATRRLGVSRPGPGRIRIGYQINWKKVIAIPLAIRLVCN
jgi:hypothetical protein